MSDITDTKKEIIRIMNKDVKREIVVLSIISLSLCMFYINLETIFTYNPKDWYDLFDFYLYDNNLLVIFSVLLIFGILFFVSGNFLFSYILMSIFTLSLGIANRIFFEFRGTFLTVKDILNLKEVLELRHNEPFDGGKYILFVLLLNILLGVVVFKCKIKRLKFNSLRHICIRALLCLIFIALYFYIFIYAHKRAYMYSIVGREKHGFFVSFNESLFENNYLAIASEEAKLILETYKSELTNEIKPPSKPNIIVIMSESFWNTDYFDNGIRISPNPMKPFFDISNNCIKGECAVDVFGGGTNISEWEFNTGASIGNPYGIPLDWYDFKDKSYDCLISYLNDKGYNTIALHGYYGDYYDRTTVYNNMGFKEIYDKKDYKNKDEYNGYISDESMTKEIIYRFEESKKKSNKPIYLFSVSIQNHIIDMERKSNDDLDKNDYVNISYHNVDINEETKRKINKYINGMYLSNLALKDLIDYFDKYDEDTVIVFFGDHAPSFYGPGFRYQKNTTRTPYLIWTNYENEFENLGDINLAYLSTVLLDNLNMKSTPLTNKNNYLMRKYKINTVFENPTICMTEKEKEEYLSDMANESIIINTYKKEGIGGGYLWTCEE